MLISNLTLEPLCLFLILTSSEPLSPLHGGLSHGQGRETSDDDPLLHPLHLRHCKRSDSKTSRPLCFGKTGVVLYHINIYMLYVIYQS